MLESSSNPGSAEISKHTGPDNEYDFVKKLGFGEKTGVDLLEESKGIMFKKNAMGELEQAAVAFGQRLSVTSAQLVAVFSAIIDDGTLYTPYITRSINDPITYDAVPEYKPVARRKVVSEDISKRMRYVLESVVANGGGKPTYTEDYKIGGKAGAAQTVENDVYSTSNYTLPFLSAASIDGPQIMLCVAVDSPQSDVLYGGTVIAPVVKTCYEDVPPYLGVKKVEGQIPERLIWPETENTKVQNFRGKKKRDVAQEGTTFTFVGSGDTVMEQVPETGTTLNAERGEVWIYPGNDKVK